MDVEPAAPDTKDWTWVLERRCPECGSAAGEVAPAAVAGRLRAAAAAWDAVLRSKGVRRRPRPRTWSPLEYGAHVRDLLEVARGRVVAMTTEDDPLFGDWDQDAAAVAGDYPGQDPAAVARALASAAEVVAALLDGVPGDAWQRPGRRSNGSVFTVASFAQYLLHDIEHHLHDVGERAGWARGEHGAPRRAARMGVVATLHLMVGLPAAGKTTYAKHLAEALGALRLTPDEWMIPLFHDDDADGKRDVLEGRLVSVALQVLRLGVDVVLDFGLWGREERYALHQLALDVGARCTTVYLPVDRETQWARIGQRWRSTPHETYPMTEDEVDRWRAQFQEPDAAELVGASPPPPSGPCRSWQEWAAERWPSLTTP